MGGSVVQVIVSLLVCSKHIFTVFSGALGRKWGECGRETILEVRGFFKKIMFIKGNNYSSSFNL